MRRIIRIIQRLTRFHKFISSSIFPLQVLVLLTDGKQINESFPLHDTPAAPVARRLELKGVKIIVVGIGFPDPVELMKIAGADSDNMEKFHNIFYLVNESVLQTEVEKVAKRICELSAPDIHSV